MPRTIWRLLALAVVLLLVPLTGCGSKHHTTPTKPATVTVPVDGLDAGTTPDRTITVPQAAVTAAAPVLHDHLADETPPGATAAELDAAHAAAEEIARTQTPLSTAGATQGFAGCRTSFVRNQSTRRGVRPQEQTLHYTVSSNRPGWSDVNAIVALFDQASFQASSNFVIDAAGNCAYIVPIEAKAWTQAAGNPFSISYEVIDTGKEPAYLPPAGMAKLKAIVTEVSRRTGIPLRRGTVSNCTPGRTGIVEHGDWGQCGGGHTDIAPFPIDQIVKQLIAGSGVTAIDRITCRRLTWWRAHGRPAGKPARNAVRRRHALDARHVACTAKGPVKR